MGIETPQTTIRMDPHDQTDEATIIRCAQNGDQGAFGVLYRRYYERVYRTVCGLVGSETEAEDITQKVWLKAWNHIDRFNFTSVLTTWLHRIAVNTSLDHLRQRKRWQGRFRSFFSSRGEGVDMEIDLPAQNADPAADLLQKEQARTIQQALFRLPEAQRIVVVLKEFEGYTYQEIADTIGCNIGTVMSRLHLARKKLRTFLPTNEL